MSNESEDLNTPQGQPPAASADTENTETTSLLDVADDDLEAAFEQQLAQAGETQKEEDPEEEISGEDSELEAESEPKDDTDDDGEVDTELEDEDSDSEDDDDAEGEDEDPNSKLPADVARIFEPFKANGKMMQIQSVDEAIKLMQMGADYTKKSQALQPQLKMIKSLQNNDLLSPEKINNMIDLMKHKPEAIKKLIQDSKIDVDEIDTDAEQEYTPDDHTASDSQLELDNVISRIEDSPKFQQTTELVTSEWDESSRAVLLNNPRDIETLNTHMENGIFDPIQEEVSRQRTLGGLIGLSDFDAYKQVGNDMLKAGKFNKAGSSSDNEPPPSEVVKPKAKASDAERKNKRRKAGASKSSGGKDTPKMPKSILGMSDDEIDKLDLSQLTG